MVFLAATNPAAPPGGSALHAEGVVLNGFSSACLSIIRMRTRIISAKIDTTKLAQVIQSLDASMLSIINFVVYTVSIVCTL